MKKDRKWIGSMIAALIAAVGIYAMMLQAERKMLDDYERGEIYVAVREIPRGTLIDDSNMEIYLEVRELEKGAIPDTALTGREQIDGLVAGRTIDKGTFLMLGMFETRNQITEQMRQPVIAGFKADDLYQVVGGVLRAGDRIHIYTVSEDGMANLIWSKVFVQQVFDSAGNSIGGGDVSASAQRINVYLDATDVEHFYTELARGTLRVVKVCE